jgi:membrane associated rhomboid family serine protease
MLPLRDANPRLRLPIVTILLIGANAVAFLFWQPTLRGGEDPEFAQQTFFWCNGLIPYEVAHNVPLAQSGSEGAAAIEADYGTQLQGEELQGYLADECPDKSPWLSVLTSMFLHGGWLHILGNMLFLWVFGDNVEDRLGKFGFLAFYLTGGVIAGALQFVFAPDSTIPNVGASGAVAAVLGAYLYLYPRARVLTGVALIFLFTLIELPATIVLGLWFVLQLFQGVTSLGLEVNGGVAYWAHVGGFAFGFVFAAVALRRRGGRGSAVPARPDAWR